MPVAIVFLLRAVVLILLWGFVVAAVVTVRHDVFGTRPGRSPAAKPAKPSKAPKPAKASKPAKPPRSATPSKVIAVEGPISGRAFALSSLPVTIGRADDSTIVIADDYVSNRHARLVPQGSTWVLEDVGSTNGTLLGTAKVTAPVVLSVGSRIKIGRTVLEIQ